MQAIDPSPAEKWAFLEPWCAVLRGRLTTEGRFSDDSALGEYWWVCVRPPTTLVTTPNRNSNDIRRLREALELLSLVAIVDNEGWKFLLLQRCDLKLDDEDDTLDGEFAARFLLRFDAAHLRYSALLPSGICRQFFLPRPVSQQNAAHINRNRASSGFQEALNTILFYHRVGGGKLETVRRWTKIPYALQFVELWELQQPVIEAHLTAMLVTLDEIRKHNEWLAGEGEAECWKMMIDEDGNETQGSLAHKEDDGTDDGHYFVYDLDSVQLCLGEIKISYDLPNVLLTTLGMSDVVVSELQLSLEQDPDDILRLGEVHPRALTAHYQSSMLFNTIFCGKSITARSNDHPQAVRRCTIEAVTIPFFGMDDQSFSGLCSSLAEASSVRKLTLGGAFSNLTSAQCAWRWKWLSYALFSDASRSSIEDVNLTSICISAEDVDNIAEVLSANVPEPRGASEAAETAYFDSGRNIKYACAPKGTCIRIKASIASPNDAITMETVDNVALRVLQDDGVSEWVSVLVPGRGNGLVLRDQLADLPQTLAFPKRVSRGVTSLSLLIDSDVENGVSVLPRLLHLVGRSIKRLSIQSIGNAALEFQAILNACPNLEQLFLDSVQIDLSAFMSVLESGQAKIKCFGLAYSNAPTESIVRFAQTLADPHSSVANEMRELCLSADNEEIPMAEESVLAFLDALQTNHKLIYLDLLVLPLLFDRYSAAFRRHHLEPLAVEKEKLPFQSRLAFLSVIKARELHRLHNDLVKAIFSFAAVCAKRTVCLRCDH